MCLLIVVLAPVVFTTTVACCENAAADISSTVDKNEKNLRFIITRRLMINLNRLPENKDKCYFDIYKCPGIKFSGNHCIAGSAIRVFSGIIARTRGWDCVPGAAYILLTRNSLSPFTVTDNLAAADTGSTTGYTFIVLSICSQTKTNC